MAVLEFDHVSKHFSKATGLARLIARNPELIRAVNDVSFDIDEGQILGVVGESGCGKTTLAKLAVRIHEATEGSVRLHGRDVREYPKREYFNEVQPVFQDPYKALNPRMRVADQIREPLLVQGVEDVDGRVRESLEFANLQPAESYLEKYPHQLSGGERQRVAIASAIAPNPSILIADEPVSMLDVSIRAGILRLLGRLAEEGTSILYISHDLATVQHICDEVAIMYLGKFMERGPVERIFRDPAHPYTERLLSAVPSVDATEERANVVYEDTVPTPVDLPDGCFFEDRCAFANDRCADEDMHLRPPAGADASDGHVMACHRAERGEIDWSELERRSTPQR